MCKRSERKEIKWEIIASYWSYQQPFIVQTAIKANMKKRQQNMQIYFIVSVVAILCYINSLSGDFVHDDLPAIVYNRDVLGTSSLSDMLLNDFWGMRMKLKESHKSYRPLTTLTFRYFDSAPLL